MVKGKKAVVEVQFNWIFILVVGALILLFFGSVVLKQRRAADLQLSDEVLSKLEAIFKGADISTGTVNIIDTPNIDLEFDCNSYSLQTTKNIRGQYIFAPPKTEGRKLLTWTASWDVPFTVANFVYITTPMIKYWFVYEDDTDRNFAISLAKDDHLLSMPSNITHPAAPISASNINTAIKDERFDRVRIVYVGTGVPLVPEDLKTVKDEEVSAVKISPDYNSKGRIGRVTFYRKQGDQFIPIGPAGSQTYVYVGRASLFGAVFVEDPDFYSCVMEKAIDKLQFVGKLYEQKINGLSDLGMDGCNYPSYGLRNAANNLDSSSFGPATAYQVAWTNLEDHNKDLQMRSCPLIY